MKVPPTVSPVRARFLVAALLVLTGCTGSATTTTSSTTVPIATTTAPDPCPEHLCVRLELDPGAVWSDGTPVTAADFAHTLEEVPTSGGHDREEGGVEVEVLGDHELVLRVSHEAVPWQSVFEVVLPAHDPGPTSGPLTPTGDGGFRGDGFRIELVEVDGVRGVIQALRRGEADLGWIPDPPVWAVEELSALEGVETIVSPGRDWEMITFNQRNPTLQPPLIRQAVAKSLDREALLDLTVRTVDPTAEPLDSTMWMHGSGVPVEPYPHSHDLEAARSRLEEMGCSPGADGIFVCDGEPLVLTWVTTAGDPWREAMVERAKEDLADAGIGVEVRLMLPEDLYAGEHLFGDGWDIASFALEAQADPGAAAELYLCDGLVNVGAHCQTGIAERIESGLLATDPEERREIFDEVDGEFLRQAAIIPLFQRPVAWAFAGAAPAPEPAPLEGPFEVAVELGRDIRIAVVETPGDPATTGPLDLLTESLRRVLYRGAFRARGDGGYEPDLVVDFEVIP